MYVCCLQNRGPLLESFQLWPVPRNENTLIHQQGSRRMFFSFARSLLVDIQPNGKIQTSDLQMNQDQLQSDSAMLAKSQALITF